MNTLISSSMVDWMVGCWGLVLHHPIPGSNRHDYSYLQKTIKGKEQHTQVPYPPREWNMRVLWSKHQVSSHVPFQIGCALATPHIYKGNSVGSHQVSGTKLQIQFCRILSVSQNSHFLTSCNMYLIYRNLKTTGMFAYHAKENLA